ncbi:MAG: helix-turn-helix transcriptional regulator [Paracoccaceae bacterium]
MFLSLLSIGATANGAVFGLALVLRGLRQGAGAALFTGGLAIVAAVVAFLIASSHAQLLPSGFNADLAEGALTVLAGPLLLLSVRRLLGWSGPKDLLLLALPVIHLLAATRMPVLATPLGAERMVAVQAAFTLCALAQAVAAPRGGLFHRRRRRAALALVAGAGCVHAVQAMRAGFADVAALRDAIPILLVATFFVLTLVTLLDRRRTAFDLFNEPLGTPPENTVAMLDRLRRAAADGYFRSRDATLAGAAARLGITPQDLSAALRSGTGQTFAEFATAARLETARTLLRDPAERRSSVEAIALLAGFGSRAAFYQAFTRCYGVTPAAYRASGEPVQPVQSGQESR